MTSLVQIVVAAAAAIASVMTLVNVTAPASAAVSKTGRTLHWRVLLFIFEP